MEVDLVACAGTASEVVEAHAWASYECRRSASTGGTCKKRTRLSILLGHISNRMRKQFTKILRTAPKKTSLKILSYKNKTQPQNYNYSRVMGKYFFYRRDMAQNHVCTVCP